MRLPSIHRLVESARDTAARFPLVIACGILSATAGIVAVDASDHELWLRLLATAALGLPLFFAIAVAAERRRWSGRIGWMARAGGLGLLAAFFIGWSGWSDPIRLERLTQAALAFHLLAAISPYLGEKEADGFWQYNKALFLRFLTAALYSAVLFVGLAIALAGVDNLLGIEISEDTYLRLWLVTAFVFNTWFFLAGTPRDLAGLGQRNDYPIGLKVFAQYVLIPLVTVYLLILTLYLAKVLITRTWPSGWIGWLVSSVAVVGILSLLLVHPIAERDENRWVDAYARWYFIALLPSIAMLLAAIWKRIDQYGITERRYFLAVLGLWLGGMALVYIITRSRNIRLIPLTLCCLALLTFAGPWSAYAVSEASQLRRLREILAANEMLPPLDSPARPSASVSFEDRREASAILRYLIETHGTSGLERLLGHPLVDADTVPAGSEPSPRSRAETRAREIAEQLGLVYVGRWESGEEGSYHYFVERRSAVVSIGAYDYALRWDTWPTDSFVVEDRVLRLSLGPDSASIRVRRDGRELMLPLTRLLDSLASGQASPERPGAYRPEALHVEGENDALAIAIYFQALSGRRTESGPRFRGGSADVYVRVK